MSDVIARCKRIMAAVDTYHERPDRMNRNTLRAMLVDEFEEFARAESRPTPEQSRDENCGNCHTCAPITMDNMRMILCEVCGNKRCPHANDHRNVCTGSNEPGQPGSAYPASRGDEAERSALGREG